MNRNPPRPPMDNENGYEQRPPRQYQQARAAPREGVRQPQTDQWRSDPYYQSQPEPVLQRQPSRPELPAALQRQPQSQGALQRQPSRPEQPSRPDQSYQPRSDGQYLQRQPSRPDQSYQQPPQLRQPQPSRPDINPDRLNQPMAMAQSQYQQVPLQPVAPVLMRNPSAPGSSYTASDSRSILTAPTRPFANSDTMLIRNNSDDELDKTDVFWRRFNASAAHEQLPDAEKSSWLEKIEGKRSQHSRILWIVGMIFVLLAAAGIGIGVYVSFKDNSNQSRPSTVGGAEDITSAGGVAATIGGAGNDGGSVTTTSLHVSPTNTINDR
ncbi:hypothetical protein C8R45DRAFT_1208159 [Mycena sanguinolenta]|nr:hypothetical protein C8R45DRAFT_1208159 [Mycena sanguinolenta]